MEESIFYPFDQLIQKHLFQRQDFVQRQKMDRIILDYTGHT